MAYTATEQQKRSVFARLCWWSEASTLIITVIYCAIVVYDVRAARADDRFSSAHWFKHGFCESWQESYANSHFLCLFADVIGGSALVFANLKQMKNGQCNVASIQLATVVSVFNVMHGLAHGAIGLNGGLGADLVEQFRPANAPIHVTILTFVGLSSFLAIGPFIGYMHGVPPLLCAAVHFPAMWSFLEYVPLQFAFGAVQLVLNFWICIPRLALVGCKTASDIAMRVDDGWPVVSIGLLLLMPIVFLEMIGCEIAMQVWGGHFIYDFSTLIMSLAYSVVVWRSSSSSEKTKSS
eukprot:TRINITY_DN49302_c0_g1_i1.p1 TRINITY_DN49302_c0_g1~~TRINITY_DN49302_c0_g1_i1.p1  ORF type:complete len:305 (+),score=26.51 TRINITY_DN49302_c0_g1_i1:35-916(+)